MPINVVNMAVVKLVAEQQHKELNPMHVLLAGIYPGLLGIAATLIAAQNSTSVSVIDKPRNLTVVPDVTGSASADVAKAAIEKSKLNAVIEKVNHEKVAKDGIIYQDPEAGVNVPVDSTVTVYVSLGKAKSLPADDKKGDHRKLAKQIADLEKDVDGKIDSLDTKIDSTTSDLKQQITDSKDEIINALKPGNGKTAS